MKPELTATGFSAQNAYFFAEMSRIAYSPENEVEGLIAGNATCEGLGYDRFHWFQVSVENQPTHGCMHQQLTSSKKGLPKNEDSSGWVGDCISNCYAFDNEEGAGSHLTMCIVFGFVLACRVRFAIEYILFGSVMIEGIVVHGRSNILRSDPSVLSSAP